MFDPVSLLIPAAWAQAAAPAAGASSGNPLSAIGNFVPLLLIFGVFYVLIIRPQQKKVEEQNKMIKALKRGDRIVVGGIYGKVSRLDDDTLTVEIADGVNVKVVRAQVQALTAKSDTQTVANDAADDDKKS